MPFGSIGRISSSGRPPRCSTVTRSTETSNRRGTSEADTPSSRQRRTMLSITACGAVEKVKIDVLDVVLLEDALQVPACPEHRQRGRAALDHERVVVEEPDRLQAELGTLRQAAWRPGGRPCRRRRSGSRGRLAAGDRAGARDEEARAADREEQRGQDPGLGGLGRGVRVVDDDHARTRSPPSSRRPWPTRSADLVQQVGAQALAVHAAGAEHREHQHAEDEDPRERRLAGTPARCEASLRRRAGQRRAWRRRRGTAEPSGARLFHSRRAACATGLRSFAAAL